MSAIKLSIIILNYNGGKTMVKNVKDLWSAADREWEIAVVDNASEDGSLKDLVTELPDIAVMPNPKNIGFAAAHNRILPMAAGEYVLLLSPDVVVDASSISHALDYMDQHPDVA